MILVLALVAPSASAHHKDGHAGGPPSSNQDTNLTGSSGDDPDTKTENCNGILPTPGSEFHNKTLVEADSDLTPGGHAVWEVTFPGDDGGNQGGNSPLKFEVTDCVLGATPDENGDYPTKNGEIDLKAYDVLDKARFENVDNDEPFIVTWAIPADIDEDIQVCNVAKTTEGPSAPPKSNRKAGSPACFTLDEPPPEEPTTVPTTAAPTTAAPTTAPPTTAAEVEDTVVEQATTAPPSTAAAQVLGETLARTGSDIKGLLLVAGLALMLGGTAVYFGESPAAARRRS